VAEYIYLDVLAASVKVFLKIHCQHCIQAKKPEALENLWLNLVSTKGGGEARSKSRRRKDTRELSPNF